MKTPTQSNAILAARIYNVLRANLTWKASEDVTRKSFIGMVSHLRVLDDEEIVLAWIAFKTGMLHVEVRSL